jgi:phage head maturation protease
VRFSKRDAVEPIWNDVVDQIIRSVSVGYKVYKVQEETPRDGGIPTRTAIDWEPYEVSMVPMPADVGARVRSGDKTHTNPCVIIARVVEDADRLRRFRLAAART